MACESVTIWQAQMKRWSWKTRLQDPSQLQEQQRERCMLDEDSVSVLHQRCRECEWKHIRHASAHSLASPRCADHQDDICLGALNV